MDPMHRDPRFWALFVAIAFGLYLSLINIIEKISLFTSLSNAQ